jgi:hypothetical protein
MSARNPDMSGLRARRLRTLCFSTDAAYLDGLLKAVRDMLATLRLGQE